MADKLKKAEVKRAFDIIFGGGGRPEYIVLNRNTFNELYNYVPFEGDSELGFSLLGIQITIDERIKDDVVHLYYSI